MLKVCYQSTMGSTQPLDWNHSPLSCEWPIYPSFQPYGAYPHQRDPKPYHNPLYHLFVQPYTMCSHNSKGQIENIKMEGMALKLWYILRCCGTKEKKFSHIRGLSLKSKGISKLERFIRPQLNCYRRPKWKKPF